MIGHLGFLNQVSNQISLQVAHFDPESLAHFNPDLMAHFNPEYPLTSHFKKYKDTVKDMVLSLELIDTELIERVNKDDF